LLFDFRLPRGCYHFGRSASGDHGVDCFGASQPHSRIQQEMPRLVGRDPVPPPELEDRFLDALL
jgi:hypothetical protein